ncbi:unnamed protein product [Discosporangium mesarthrocarpum]
MLYSVLGRVRPPVATALALINNATPPMTWLPRAVSPRLQTVPGFGTGLSETSRGWPVGQSRGMASGNHRHKKIIKMAKGYRGRSKNVFKIAIQKVQKALENAYRDRKNKKRNFRRLWIERINAGVRQHGMSYSVFTNQAAKAQVELNRKVLAEMAVTEPYSFRSVVETVKAHGR